MKKIIGAVLAVLLVLAGVCYDYIGEHQKNNAAGTAEAQQSQQTQQENEDLTKSPNRRCLQVLEEGICSRYLQK